MNITPSQAAQATGPQTNDAAQFDNAIQGAQQELSDEALMKELVEGAVKAAGSMLIMPKANEILNEVLSDD